MSDDPDERRGNFQAWMERTGTNVKRVAEATGIPMSTLYGFTSGRYATLKGPNEAKIASAFDTSVQAIFGAGGARQVDVMGRIGARAEVRPFDELGEAVYRVDLSPGLSEDETYVAFEVEGVSMPPAQPGWVVFFRRKPLPLEQLIGYPVLVDLIDGRRLFKVLRRGYTPGCWNLESWDGSPLIEDQRITAALPFAAMTPGRQQR